MLRIAIFSLLCCIALPAFANDNELPLSKEYSECMDKADSNTFKILDCTQSEYERQDKRLNVAYKKLMAGLSEERKRDLQAAQRAWLNYRELYSKYLYDPDGGHAARMGSSSWHMSITASRVQELEAELRLMDQ